MVKLTFVNYVCPICQRGRQGAGSFPPTCSICGQVICNVCGKMGLCPTCYNYLTQDEKSFYDSVMVSKLSHKLLICIFPSFCFGLLFVFVGVSALLTPGAMHDVAIILILLGGFLTVTLCPINLIIYLDVKKLDKRRNAVHVDLIQKIKQRRKQ